MLKTVNQLEMSYTYDYPRPMVATDCVVFHLNGDKVEVLMIKRKNDPFKGYWALPGGFLEMDEDLETSARRELREETGIADIDLYQLHTFGDVNRDPRGRVISVVYTGISKEKVQPKAADDADDAEWLTVQRLNKLAFDHDIIIKMAFDKMRSVHPEIFEL